MNLIVHLNNQGMKSFLTFLFFMIATHSSFAQLENPAVLKSTDFKCLSGDCKNGLGVALSKQKYCRKKCATCGPPECYNLWYEYQIIKGSFKNGVLNGFCSIALPANPTQGVPDWNKNSKEKEFLAAVKKLQIPVDVQSLAEYSYPFRVNYVIEGDFKDGDPVGTMKCYDEYYLSKHCKQGSFYWKPMGFSTWNRQNEEATFQKFNISNQNVLERIYYGRTVRNNISRSSGMPLTRIDSSITICDKGNFKTAFIYDKNGLPKSAYSSITYDGKIDKRVIDYGTGWDLLITNPNGENKIERQLILYFDDDAVTVASGLYTYPDDQANYGEIRIDDSTNYMGGRNEDGLPHGFGILTTTQVDEYNVILNDTITYTKIYSIYAGYFRNGEKSGYGHEYQKREYRDFVNNQSENVTIWEYWGKFSHGFRDGRQNYFAYYFKGNEANFYEGTYFAKFNDSPYPYEGRKYRMKNKMRPLYNAEVGQFNEKGMLSVSYKDNTKEKKMLAFCLPMLSVVNYNGKMALLIRQDKQFSYLSDGRKLANTITVEVDLTANPDDFLCVCPNCNGGGTTYSNQANTEVNSYNKQVSKSINYLGLEQITTYHITEVQEKPIRRAYTCENCRGKGKIVCSSN